MNQPLLHPQVGGRGQDDQPQGNEGHGVVHALPEAAAERCFFWKSGCSAAAAKRSQAREAASPGWTVARTAAAFSRGISSFFEGGGDQGFHPGGGRSR